MTKRKAVASSSKPTTTDNKKVKIDEKLNDEEFEGRLKVILEAIDDHEIELHGIQMMNELFGDSNRTQDTVRYNSLFKKIFEMIISSKNSNEILITNLKKKIDYLSLEMLIECTGTFVSCLKSINNNNKECDLSTEVFYVCVSIMNLLQEHEDFKLIETKFNSYLNELIDIDFNDRLIIKLTNLFQTIILNNIQATFFFNKIFDHNFDKINLSEIFESLIDGLLGVYKQERGLVLDRIISYFHNLNIESDDFIINRVSYNRAEQSVIASLTKFTNRDRAASQDFLNSISTILDRNVAKDKYISKFTISLILTQIQSIQKQFKEKLTKTLVNSIEKLVEIDVNCSKFKWLSVIMGIKSRSIVKKVTNSLEFNRVSKSIDSQIAMKSLIELSMNLLDEYGEAINAYSEVRGVSSVNHCLTSISNSILKDLFQNCPESRELICKCLLNEIFNFSSSDQDKSVYIGQFEVIFSSNQQQDVKVENIIMKYLIKGIYGLSIPHVLRLFKIIEPIISQQSTGVKKLIEMLKENNKDEIKNQKMNIFGLIMILKSFCKKSENDVKCVELFDFVKSKVSSVIDVEIKSFFYQSLKEMMMISSVMEETIFSFLVKKLTDHVNITSTQSLFKLDCCINRQNLTLVEPIDILLHSGHTCLVWLKKSEKRGGVENLILKLEELFEQIITTYTDNDADFVFNIYKKQIENHHPSSSSLIKIQHQLQLGLIDSLIEHSFYKKNYNKILILIERYEQISNFISIEIEDLMSPIMKQDSVTTTTNTTGDRRRGKRKRVEEDNKENTPFIPSKRQQFNSIQQQLTPPTTPAGKQIQRKTIKNLSFTNIIFEHTFRISYSSISEILQMFINYVDIDDESGGESSLMNEENLNAFLSLFSNDSFADFFNQIISQKLQSILNHSATKSSFVYDQEGLDDEQLFNFLKTIWRVFWKRIHGLSNDDTRQSFHELMSIRYSPNYLNKILKYQTYLNNIWTIVSRLYANKIIQLFPYHAGSNGEIVRKALDSCKNSIYSYNSENGSQISCKILTQLYNQIIEIIARFPGDFKTDEYIQWLTKQIGKLQKTNFTIGQTMVNVLFRLNEIRDSKIVQLNSLSHELENFIKRESDEIFDYTSSGFICQTQFHLFCRDNLNSYFQILSQEAIQFISLIEWFLKYNEKFESKNCLEMFYKQLFSMINNCYHQMSSVYNISFVYQFTQHLIHFYDLMTKFIQHRIRHGMSVDERYSMRKIINLISKKLQMNLSFTFNRIQDYMLNEEQQREGKADANEISKILRYKHSVNCLFDKIYEFEQELVNLNNIYRQLNYMNDYKIFISNLEIRFQSKITRTISEHQINKIMDFTNEISN